MSRASPVGKAWKKLYHLWQREIWRFEHLGDRSPRGLFFSVLRVLSITVTGLRDTKVASRAAALSFSSLLGLGPLVAIVMLVAGFVLNNQSDPDLAARKLDGLLHQLLPQLVEYDQLRAKPVPPAPVPPTADAPGGQTAPAVNPAASVAPAADVAGSGTISETTKLINSFIAGSNSKTVGVIGVLTLIVIVLQLFTSVENAFNEIWGVRRGRSLIMRVVFYWTVLTLGAVLFFAAVAGLSASALINALASHLPLGSALVDFARLLLPSLSVLLLVAVLTLFYRFIPNTKVWWRAALIGAVVVAALLVLNNYLAFLYVRRVALQSSLYGPLSLLPVLMAGLYIFWFFILVGGQLSYAVQNVHFRNSQAVWASLAESMRERLSLLVLLTISRRFQACLPPSNAARLGGMLKVPTQILNECLNRLVQMQLITPLPPAAGETATDFLYQPARPLSRITLGEFKRLDDDFGDVSASPMLAGLDPLVKLYDDSLNAATIAAFFQKPLDQLLAEYPVDASRPPFAFGQRIKREES
jgi:membrane protein